MADYKHVMICGELTDGGVASITRELLNGGRKLADNLGEEFHALFLGNGVTERAREALAFGADNVYVVDNPCLDTYEGDSYATVLAQTVERLRPRILVFGNTEVGADLGPRLAFKLRRAIATDCVALEVDSETGTLLRTKPIYGGLAMAVLASDGFPQTSNGTTQVDEPRRKDRVGGWGNHSTGDGRGHDCPSGEGP